MCPMKKISFFVLMICAFFSPAFADSYLNLEQFLRGYLSVVTENIELPGSYTSIVPKFTNVPVKSILYPLLQKAIYLDIFPNAKMALPLNKKITEAQATSIVRRAFPDVITGDQRRFASMDWLVKLSLSLQNKQIKFATESSSAPSDFFTQSDLYQDVLYRISSKYYYHSGINQTGILYGGIEGMVK